MKTKITFIQESPTYVGIYLNGKAIGHIYSEMKDGTTPYPHDESEYCKTSVQLCGFDNCSEIYNCGIFSGRKDLIVNFSDNKTPFMTQEEKEYRNYVKEFLESKIEMDKLVSFQTWVQHMHHPSISYLRKEALERLGK